MMEVWKADGTMMEVWKAEGTMMDRGMEGRGNRCFEEQIYHFTRCYPSLYSETQR